MVVGLLLDLYAPEQNSTVRPCREGDRVQNVKSNFNIVQLELKWAYLNSVLKLKLNQEKEEAIRI